MLFFLDSTSKIKEYIAYYLFPLDKALPGSGDSIPYSLVIFCIRLVLTHLYRSEYLVIMCKIHHLLWSTLVDSKQKVGTLRLFWEISF